MQSGEKAHHDGSPAPLASVAGWLAIPIGLVVLSYLWFISAGLWSSWPKTAVYDYYSSLASAFQKGQLYLDDQPSPELLALPDPYRIGARKGGFSRSKASQTCILRSASCLHYS